MHTSGYEYAVKNGYKKSEQEWLEEWYKNYKAICARSCVKLVKYDEWVLIASAVSEVAGGAQ